jgi:hypothetical protein
MFTHLSSQWFLSFKFPHNVLTCILFSPVRDVTLNLYSTPKVETTLRDSLFHLGGYRERTTSQHV